MFRFNSHNDQTNYHCDKMILPVLLQKVHNKLCTFGLKSHRSQSQRSNNNVAEVFKSI